MSPKTILIAHRLPAVRDRFAVAVADARHHYVTTDSEEQTRQTITASGAAISLALVDLTLADDGVALVRGLKTAEPAMPVMVFSGSISGASQIPPLTAMEVGFINEHAGTPQILPALAPYLFPDNFNRRMNLRMALGVPVTYRTGETVAGAVTLDIGKGGLAIRTLNPLPKGTAVKMRFRLPGLPSEIDAAGRVAWSDRKVGMGVQFERVSASHQRSIDGFVDAHA